MVTSADYNNLFDFKNTNILVVGDIKLDTYWYATTNRTSPEAPVPIALYKNSDDRLSGSGLIAAIIKNLAGDNAKIDLIAAIGKQNDINIKTNELLNNYNISSENLYKILNFTNHSIRVVSSSQQLLRIDNNSNDNNTHNNTKDNLDLLQILTENKYNTVLFYAGFNNNIFLKKYLDYCNKSNVRTIYVLDSIASIYNYSKERCQADFVILNKLDLIKLSPELVDEIFSNFARICVLTIDDPNGLELFIKETKERTLIPAINSEVENTIGLTEMVAVVFTLGINTTNNPYNAALLANAAGMFSVRQFAQSVINVVELQLAYADCLLSNKYRFLRLKQEINAAKLKNQKIVFANGCFDVVHAGHIAYLELAKQRGDKLFVAINSDCSIARLKGSSRPINTLSDRLTVLTALEDCDWVVPFFTDTPEDFLRWLQPDLLVKGGDYEEEGVIGRDIVYSYGGKIEIIKHPYNHISSTKILESN